MLAVGAILLLVVLLSGMAPAPAIHIGSTYNNSRHNKYVAHQKKSRKKESTSKQ